MATDSKHPLYTKYHTSLRGLQHTLGVKRLSWQQIPKLSWDIATGGWYVRLDALHLETPYGSKIYIHHAKVGMTLTELLHKLGILSVQLLKHPSSVSLVLPRIHLVSIDGLKFHWLQEDPWRFPKPKHTPTHPGVIHDTTWVCHHVHGTIARHRAIPPQQTTTLTLNTLRVEHVLSESNPLTVALQALSVKGLSTLVPLHTSSWLNAWATQPFSLNQLKLTTRYGMGWRWQPHVFHTLSQLASLEAQQLEWGAGTQKQTPITQFTWQTEPQTPSHRPFKTTHLNLALRGNLPDATVGSRRFELSGTWHQLPDTWQHLMPLGRKDPSVLSPHHATLLVHQVSSSLGKDPLLASVNLPLAEKQTTAHHHAPLLSLTWQQAQKQAPAKLAFMMQPIQLDKVITPLPLRTSGVLGLHLPNLMPLVSYLGAKPSTHSLSHLEKTLSASTLLAQNVHVGLRAMPQASSQEIFSLSGTFQPHTLSKGLTQTLQGTVLGVLPWHMAYTPRTMLPRKLSRQENKPLLTLTTVHEGHAIPLQVLLTAASQRLLTLQHISQYILPKGHSLLGLLGRTNHTLQTLNTQYAPQGQLEALWMQIDPLRHLPLYHLALSEVRIHLKPTSKKAWLQPFVQPNYLSPAIGLQAYWDTRTLTLKQGTLSGNSSMPWASFSATLPLTLSHHTTQTVAPPFQLQATLHPQLLQAFLKAYTHTQGYQKPTFRSTPTPPIDSIKVTTPTLIQLNGTCPKTATVNTLQRFQACRMVGSGYLSALEADSIHLAPTSWQLKDNTLRWQAPLVFKQRGRVLSTGVYHLVGHTWQSDTQFHRVNLGAIHPWLPPKPSFQFSTLQGEASGGMSIQGKGRQWDWQGYFDLTRLTLGLHLPLLQGNTPPENLFRVPKARVSLLPRHHYQLVTKPSLSAPNLPTGDPVVPSAKFQALYGDFPLAHASLKGHLPASSGETPQLTIALESLPASPSVTLPALQDWLPHTQGGEAPWLKQIWHSEGQVSLKGLITLGQQVHHVYTLTLHDVGLSAPQLLGTPLPLSHLNGQCRIALSNQTKETLTQDTRLNHIAIATPLPIQGYWGDSPGQLSIEKSQFFSQQQTLSLNSVWQQAWEPGTLNTLLQQGLQDITARALPLRFQTHAHLHAQVALNDFKPSLQPASPSPNTSHTKPSLKSWLNITGDILPSGTAFSTPYSQPSASTVAVPMAAETTPTTPEPIPAFSANPSESLAHFTLRMTPDKLVLNHLTVRHPNHKPEAQVVPPTVTLSAKETLPPKPSNDSSTPPYLLEAQGWWQLPTDPTWQKAYQSYLKAREAFDAQALTVLLQKPLSEQTSSQTENYPTPPSPPPLQNQWSFLLDPQAHLESMLPASMGIKGNVRLRIGQPVMPSTSQHNEVPSRSLSMAKVPFIELTTQNLGIASLNIQKLDATLQSQIPTNTQHKSYLAPLNIDVQSFQSPGIDLALEATVPIVEWLSRPTSLLPIPLQDVRIKPSKQLDIASLQDFLGNLQTNLLRPFIAPQTQSLITTAWQQPAGLGFTFEQAPFAFNEVLLNTMILKDVQGQIALHPSGLIELKPLQFKLAGGTVESRLWMNPLEQNLTSLEMVANQVKANPLMMVLVGTPNKVFGTMDAKLQVVTQGTTVQSMLQNANGQAIFNLQEGRIPDIDGIEKLLTTANILRGGILGWNLNSFAKVFFNDKRFKPTHGSTVSGSFQIARGVAYTHDLMTTSENLGLLFDGGMRLDNGLSSFRLTGQSMIDTYGMFGGVGRWSLSKAIRNIPVLGYLPGGRPGVLGLLPGLTYIPGFGGPVSDRARFSAEIEGTLDHVVRFRWIRLSDKPKTPTTKVSPHNP
jgi:hypothetical protein